MGKSDRKEESMQTDKSGIVAFTLGAVILGSIANLAFAQEGVTRTVILKQSLEADPTKEVTVFVFELKPGGPASTTTPVKSSFMCWRARGESRRRESRP